MRRSSALFLALLFSASSLKAQELPPTVNLPEIGKWLLDKKGKPAHWLGLRYRGKTLLEPINVAIIDPFSATAAEATDKLLNECRRDGYEEESGHSAGYSADIDHARYQQIPAHKRIAFSTGEFFVTNNHGRIMGPARTAEGFVFVGAFSCEAFRTLNQVHHVFLSFNVARNDFCRKLDSGGHYAIAGNYNLNNVLNDAKVTTADHDGQVILLVARKP
jgi:hypothetical protein